MECGPPWLVAKAVRREHDENWADAYVPVDELEGSQNANVLGEHIVYKVDTEEYGSLRLKHGIFPHGNHDKEQEEVQKDSATAQFDVTRLLLAVMSTMPFRIGSVDVKGAHLHSGPIRRQIYVGRPK